MERMNLLEINTFLKNRNKKQNKTKETEHWSFVCNYSPEASVEAGQCRLESSEERLEWEALGKDVEKWWSGNLSLVITPIPHGSSHFF